MASTQCDDAGAITFSQSTSSAGLWATCFLGQEPEVLRIARFELYRFVLSAALAFPLYLAIVLLITRDVDKEFLQFKILAGGLLYIPILLFAGNSRLKWTKFVRELRTAAATPRSMKPCTLRIGLDDSGVILEREQSSHTLKWSMFERIVRLSNNDIGFQYARNWNGITIPASAFPSAEAADIFAARAERLLTASGNDQTSRLCPLLADTTLCCSCGHALVGLRSARCPECGRGLSTMTLKSLEFVQAPLHRKILARWS